MAEKAIRLGGESTADAIVSAVDSLPTAQALIAAWPAGVPGHSWQVVACGKTSLAHKAILCAGKTLATAAIALIDDPALLQKAREEYAGRAGSGYVCPIEPDAVPIAI